MTYNTLKRSEKSGPLNTEATAGEITLSLPKKEVSAWVTETDPREAQAWLASLPLADAGNAARDLYQALYALNRLDIGAQTRVELMDLYRGPVGTVSSVLETQLNGLALPLPSAARQMAEFVRQLQMEMAIGYKCAFQDLQIARVPWGKKSQLTLATARAMAYLGEVLRHSYEVYMPQPPGVWKEIHALYRYAEAQGSLDQPLATADSEEGKTGQSVGQHYRAILLLALCNPYQLPQNECTHVAAFLSHWAHKASIGDNTNVADPVGHFLVNLAADMPPAPMVQPRGVRASTDLRVLNTIELARTVHGFSKRLEQGEGSHILDLGGDLTGTAAREMLRRMIKFWGLTPTRRYARTRTRGYLYLCSGINALHFFVSGRKPFAPPVQAPVETLPPEPGEELARKTAAKALADAGKAGKDAPAPEAKGEAASMDSASGLPRWLADAKLATPEAYPVDRWQLRDESARGLLLAREGEVAIQLRVGDVLGMQGTNGGGWHAGVIRWIKSPEAKRVEMGVERLAPKVTPVAVCPADSLATRRYAQGLLLPAMPVLQRPTTLLVPRGIYEPTRDLELTMDDGSRRLVRVLRLLERTASFDQIVFADRNQR